MNKKNSPLKKYFEFKHANKNRLFVREILGDILNNVVTISLADEVKKIAQNLIKLSWNSTIFINIVDFTNVDRNVKNYYKKNIILKENQIIDLCYATKAQSDSDEWFRSRKVRITASSKAHKVKTCKKVTFESLADGFVKEDNILRSEREQKSKGITALDYGKKNEPKAIENFCKLYNVKVYQIGAFVMPAEPWLLVSTDGIVEQNENYKLLEIKCPYSCKTKPVFDESQNKCNVGYLEVVDQKIQLKKSHMYYTQVQVSMYATGLQSCDFFVWSKKGSCLVEVLRDNAFLSKVIPLLKKFYFSNYLQAIHKKFEETNKENVINKSIF